MPRTSPVRTFCSTAERIQRLFEPRAGAPWLNAVAGPLASTLERAEYPRLVTVNP
jgi:hypothetical protein